jgi:hypothetical protein
MPCNILEYLLSMVDAEKKEGVQRLSSLHSFLPLSLGQHIVRQFL